MVGIRKDLEEVLKKENIIVNGGPQILPMSQSLW